MDEDEPEPVELPIDGELDLHAFRPREVAALVHDYLDACRERGILEVRLVHGKGTGQLRRTVHAALDRRTDVASYALAPPGRGAWGATIVHLKPEGLASAAPPREAPGKTAPRRDAASPSPPARRPRAAARPGGAMPIAVLGATGRMGGATARALLERGLPVRAITRNPAGDAAQALAAAGAEVSAADMADVDALVAAIEGCTSLFNVQPAFDSRGRYDGPLELRQGQAVAEAVRRAGVAHVVFGGAGTGTPTGLPHVDTKLRIEEALHAAAPRVHTLFPCPFMELMTDPGFAPALSTWGAEPNAIGWDRPIPWIAARDIGRAAAALLANPDALATDRLVLAADTRTLGEAWALYTEAFGRRPRRVPLPVFVFRWMVGDELPSMWEAIGTETFAEPDVEAVRALVPDLLDVPAFLRAAAGR